MFFDKEAYIRKARERETNEYNKTTILLNSEAKKAAIKGKAGHLARSMAAAR